jgi:hypothetical protein
MEGFENTLPSQDFDFLSDQWLFGPQQDQETEHWDLQNFFDDPATPVYDHVAHGTSSLNSMGDRNAVPVYETLGPPLDTSSFPSTSSQALDFAQGRFRPAFVGNSQAPYRSTNNLQSTGTFPSPFGDRVTLPAFPVGLGNSPAQLSMSVPKPSATPFHATPTLL